MSPNNGCPGRAPWSTRHRPAQPDRPDTQRPGRLDDIETPQQALAARHHGTDGSGVLSALNKPEEAGTRAFFSGDSAWSEVAWRRGEAANQSSLLGTAVADGSILGGSGESGNCAPLSLS